jgi:Domain of unknown function (DUF5679)
MDEVNNNMYCIKCRSHTENVDLRHEEITSKGLPRSVMKATCAVCSKRKNRFSKTAKAEGESTVGTEQVGQVENKVKKQRETKVSKKLIENLLQKFIESVSLKSDENES